MRKEFEKFFSIRNVREGGYVAVAFDISVKRI